MAHRDRAIGPLDIYAQAVAIEALAQVDIDDPTFVENLRYAVSAGVELGGLPDLTDICAEIAQRRTAPNVDGPIPIARLLDRALATPPLSPSIQPIHPRLDRSFP